MRLAAAHHTRAPPILANIFCELITSVRCCFASCVCEKKLSGRPVTPSLELHPSEHSLPRVARRSIGNKPPSATNRPSLPTSKTTPVIRGYDIDVGTPHGVIRGKFQPPVLLYLSSKTALRHRYQYICTRFSHRELAIEPPVVNLSHNGPSCDCRCQNFVERRVGF